MGYKIENTDVLFLDETDLTRRGVLKKFEDVNFFDFKINNKEIGDVGVIIYQADGKYRVLKSRY